jgi:hypothetical protein
MRVLYKPLAIIAGLIAARLGRSVFKSMWAKIDGAPPPTPLAGDAGLGKTVGARALEGAVMAGSAAAVNGVFARVFHYLLGSWPKKSEPPEDED